MPDTAAFPSNAAIDGVKAASLRPHFLIDRVGSGVYLEVRSTRERWIGSKAVRAAHLPGQVGSSLFEELTELGLAGLDIPRNECSTNCAILFLNQ